MFGKNLFIAGVFALAATSCVTQKKYDDLNARKTLLEAEKAACADTLQLTVAENERLTKQLSDNGEQLDALEREVSILKTDTTQAGIVLRKTVANYAIISDSYERLLSNYDKLRTNSASEASKLSSNLAQREKQLAISEEKINNLKADLQAREVRVKELEQILADKEKAVANLKHEVSNALLGFKDSDLKVEVKNGKVHVSLSEQLLFKSGKTDVDPKGIEALKKLASVLKEQKDLSVTVEGHTDDVPVAKGTSCIEDNWDLSVLRATSIVRILMKAGVQPEKMFPGGRGEYMPIVEGDTKEARRLNRRTEIILTPKLDELFKILNN